MDVISYEKHALSCISETREELRNKYPEDRGIVKFARGSYRVKGIIQGYILSLGKLLILLIDKPCWPFPEGPQANREFLHNLHRDRHVPGTEKSL
ncbi:hypothetical protein GOP47_0009247 [Adiantum capillus-veneris]|uniref:Uncharacterized protein n=1 Tax=Adiantum capillus-veneris TaxID=13818 RepID=A0A9D4UWE1_ADICA|nr:hypothetical protein GOP47_0009247 [Adiantum capillus-veneris]